MERKTSVSEGYNEFRARVGLQYFAEGEGDTGADMDGFDGDAFAAALLDGDGENQPDAEQQTGEGAEEGLENQQPEGQPGEPETQPPEGGEQDQQQPPAQPPQATVPLTFNGQQMQLPADAVDAIGAALGQEARQVVALMQKGMNYDSKAARELRVLNEYAKASGMDLNAYVEGLEAHAVNERINAEAQKVAAEFPGTPEAAVKAIAKQRVEAAQAAERAQAEQERQRVAAAHQRVKQTVAETKRQAEIKAWDAYEAISGVHKPEDIPPRVMELVKQGYTPREAHFALQAEQAQEQAQTKAAIQQQESKNKQQTPGSMAGAGEESGFEAEFLKGFN